MLCHLIADHVMPPADHAANRDIGVPAPLGEQPRHRIAQELWIAASRVSTGDLWIDDTATSGASWSKPLGARGGLGAIQGSSRHLGRGCELDAFAHGKAHHISAFIIVVRALRSVRRQALPGGSAAVVLTHGEPSRPRL